MCVPMTMTTEQAMRVITRKNDAPLVLYNNMPFMACTASLNRLLTQEHSDTKKSIYHPRKNYSVACLS